MKYTIIRKEFYIIETFSEIEVNDKELKRLSELDKDEYEDELSDKFRDGFKIYSSDSDDYGLYGENTLTEKKFEIPEQNEYLGSIDIIVGRNDSGIINNNLTNVYNELDPLLDKKTLKTFYWDYSKYKIFNIKGFIRSVKLNKLLKNKK